MPTLIQWKTTTPTVEGTRSVHTLATILRQVRALRVRGDSACIGDGELLRRFQVSGDEAAFELLLWRHGPMVLGVCRRVLRDDQAAEDAFQATFLALARKAGTISTREAVGSWLYTVAHRIALAARERLARRRASERAADGVGVDEPSYVPADEPAARELEARLRAEVDRLPAAFRAVIVLCCLEGRTHAEAAEQLGVPAGTVESRLVRARTRLRRRLTASGLALAAAPFAAFLAEHLGELAKVSPVLVHGTLHLVLLFKMSVLAAAAAAGPVVELMEQAVRPVSIARRLIVAGAVILALLVGGAAAMAAAPALWQFFTDSPAGCH